MVLLLFIKQKKSLKSYLFIKNIMPSNNEGSWRLQSTYTQLCYCYRQALPASHFITADSAAITDNNPVSLKVSTGLPQSSPRTQGFLPVSLLTVQQKMFHYRMHPYLSAYELTVSETNPDFN